MICYAQSTLNLVRDAPCWEIALKNKPLYIMKRRKISCTERLSVFFLFKFLSIVLALGPGLLFLAMGFQMYHVLSTHLEYSGVAGFLIMIILTVVGIHLLFMGIMELIVPGFMNSFYKSQNSDGDGNWDF